MQRRLIASIVGGVVGICLALPLQGVLGVSETVAFIACSVGGMVLAYVASMLFDVFAGTAPPGTTPE
jgi:hypothetical protein